MREPLVGASKEILFSFIIDPVLSRPEIYLIHALFLSEDGMLKFHVNRVCFLSNIWWMIRFAWLPITFSRWKTLQVPPTFNILIVTKAV